MYLIYLYLCGNMSLAQIHTNIYTQRGSEYVLFITLFLKKNILLLQTSQSALNCLTSKINISLKKLFGM